MSYPDNDYRDYLMHYAKGEKAAKHKYLYIDANGNYVYPKDKSSKHSMTETRTVNGNVGSLSYTVNKKTHKMGKQTPKDKNKEFRIVFNKDGSIKTLENKVSRARKRDPFWARVDNFTSAPFRSAKNGYNSASEKYNKVSKYASDKFASSIIGKGLKAANDLNNERKLKKFKNALNTKFSKGGGTTTVKSGKGTSASSPTMSVKTPRYKKKSKTNVHGGSGRKF